MEFRWRIIVGTVIGFLGATSGSIGGIGGGGIFVPMLALIIGFDTKSATAISKCMVMATAGATSYFNLRKQHPTLLDQPLIDYDLALLIQPSLVLGISIGVTLNVITVTSTRTFRKGIEVWNNENRARAANGDAEYVALPETPRIDEKVRLITNVHWKEVSILVSVWLAILGIQIAKNNSTTCSAAYWALNLLQIPVALGASSYEAVMLYKGSRAIESRGDEVGSNPKWNELALCCGGAILAGTAGGMLGLGGGFVLSPFLLEMGIPPKVTGATAMFAITFSSSMSVVEYYLLHRFPVPYAVYFFGVAIVATLVGQLVITKLIEMVGRESVIVFVLAFTIFISAILLGKHMQIEF
ncbi:hypothetical protein V2J09_005465 [Rumex salicifolius]